MRFSVVVLSVTITCANRVVKNRVIIIKEKIDYFQIKIKKWYLHQK